MDVRKFAIGMVGLAAVTGTGYFTLAQAGQPDKQVEKTGESKGEEKEEQKEETEIKLGDAPAAVNAAVAKVAKAENIKKVIKEQDEGVTTYEVEFTDNGVECAAIFSSAGDLMELERATPQDKLPAALMAALKKDYPKASFENPQIVTKTFYEVEIVVEGKKHAVVVDAAGNIEDESKGGDEKHEHANGDEHGKQHDEDKKGEKDEKDEEDKD